MDQLNKMIDGVQTFDMQALLKQNDVSRPVQQHLGKVYGCLAGGVLAAAAGSTVHIYTGMGGMLSTLATIGLMYMMMSGTTTAANTQERVGIFAGFCFCKGLTLGHFIQAMLFVDPSILVTAFLASVAVFACFSLSAMFAKRRSMLYMSGLLSSAMSVMCLLSFISMFTYIPAFMNINLYVGLMVFCGYVCVDTQMTIEKASRGDRDFPKHAMELFINFVAIFVRIAIILMRNKRQSDDRKRKNSRRR